MSRDGSVLSHVDAAGRARMVDVSGKPETARTATASGALVCLPETLQLVREGRTPKGAVVSTAEIAGVMAAKKTPELIPLCHPLPLSKAVVSIEEDPALPGSQGACKDGWDKVLSLELDSRHRPCSLAGQIPRLRDVCP